MLNGLRKKVERKLLSWLPGPSPDFMIIGAQKAGTSSLHFYLNQHPLLSGSKIKEIHYFDKWINYGHDYRWYHNHFKRSVWPKHGTQFFESTPSYIYYEEVASLLKAYDPDLRLILLLRDPVERAFSAWNMYYDFFRSNTAEVIKEANYPGTDSLIYQLYYKDRVEFPSFSEAYQIELELGDKRISNAKEPALLRRGLYAQQIETYLKYFDQTQLHIIGFKDLINRTEETVKDICTFLNVPPVKFELNKEPRNAREYSSALSEKDRKFLEVFYKAENNQLFNLLGKTINW